MRKTFASYSFGCRVNQAEKEVLDRQLISIGFTHSQNNPDFFIINTCAVTAKAEREARQLIYQTKRKWPETKIIITGCAATKWINENTRIREVDWLIDNTNKEYIAQLLNSKVKNQKSNTKLKTRNLNIVVLAAGDTKDIKRSRMQFSQIAYGTLEPKLRTIKRNEIKSITKNNADLEFRNLVSKKITPASLNHNKFLQSGRLLLKIQDGCQRFCTFCIVPYVRGRPKSVPIAQIIKIINNAGTVDVKQKAIKTLLGWPSYKDSPGVEGSKDIKEVILTAINTQAYGFDTGESFIDLVDQIIKETKIERVSFGSIHPWSINDDFLKFYKKVLPQKRLVNFFHIPLQSGSNKILQRMKRGYSREEFMEKLNTLQKINPSSFIATDIIVGFLEETDRDFEDTYNFLKDSPIYKFHVFRFSPREKTAAFYMRKRLKEPTSGEKTKRAKILIELSKIKYQQFLTKHIGKTFPALFLERRMNGHQEALLDNQIPVYINTSRILTGGIYQVKIDELVKNQLFGRVV